MNDLHEFFEVECKQQYDNILETLNKIVSLIDEKPSVISLFLNERETAISAGNILKKTEELKELKSEKSDLKKHKKDIENACTELDQRIKELMSNQLKIHSKEDNISKFQYPLDL